ncbi:T9SS type A sorting domain-containing protein [Chryseobacterium sp. Tr-659]|uniref:T9SS type A sorting domain-containing protein n=1 Tax=Chryseobacterium sp. Tr-659 TaxID=2608340 RepID=UPI0014224D3E|nr:T9SS type A sorting domain-containing protein [Chryseobacterium sp. Tr-659]NIF07462.1 T9SS type A sorting domain-containing protein [Chryseobacterium sp. Tr-659]
MKKTLLFLLLLSFSFSLGQITKRVFFIGNSYTYANDLPALIKNTAASTGDILDFHSQTPGGSTLQDHANNPNTTAIINQGNWDYVVLQEQSQLPSFPDSQVQAQVYPYALQLSNLIKNSNACGNVVFYMTWGRKNGDASVCPGWPAVCTYQGMDDLLYTRYMEMANTNEGLVSPVGKVWRIIREQDPSLELYDQDESHPSYIGSMAAAYTFYTILFKKDPTQVPFNGNLPQTQAQFIKNIVKTEVFDQLNKWYVTANDVHSRFIYQMTGTGTVQFTNKTQNASTYLWDFGDGTTSTLENPTHTYSASGSYSVKLTTDACETNTSKTKLIVVTTLNTAETPLEDPVLIYPNPAQNMIHINAKNEIEILSLTDTAGRKIGFHSDITDAGYSIALHHLTSGIYFLHYKTGEKEFIKKIIKK